MTYEELKALGFSHETIIEQGVFPAEQAYTVEQCAEAWKIGKSLADKKYAFTTEQVEQFKTMMNCYTILVGDPLPRIKGLTK